MLLCQPLLTKTDNNVAIVPQLEIMYVAKITQKKMFIMCPGMRNDFWTSQNKAKSLVGYIYVCEVLKFRNFIEKN